MRCDRVDSIDCFQSEHVHIQHPSYLALPRFKINILARSSTHYPTPLLQAPARTEMEWLFAIGQQITKVASATTPPDVDGGYEMERLILD
jgi:hypothetical protein